MTVFILGGAQTDFARHYAREGLGLKEMLWDSVGAGLESARLEPFDVQVAHVGNFAAELFAGQGQLGGLFASLAPEFDGVSASRHEAACASGSMAVLAAMADLEAGFADVACVVGVEQMRNVDGEVAAQHLGCAALAGKEGLGARYLWPSMFDALATEYESRYGLDYSSMMAVAEQNYQNGKRNPNAQSRSWSFPDGAFTADDTLNPPVEGRIRRLDCGQISDGSATVLLAAEKYAEEYARKRGVELSSLARIEGFSHRTSRLELNEKLEASRDADFMFPQLRLTLEQAWERAGVKSDSKVDCLEVHDCFSITELVLLDHFGGFPPGQAHLWAESGRSALGGALPVNPSGGLIGGGHPVGATGVRMLLDAYKQVTNQAGDYQVEGAKRAQTINIGGSFSTTASFVVAA